MLPPDSAMLHPGYLPDVARMEHSGIRGPMKATSNAEMRENGRQPCALRLASARRRTTHMRIVLG